MYAPIRGRMKRTIDVMTDSMNQVIANRYQVLALLGKGGMGEVYRVVDQLEGNPELEPTLLWDLPTIEALAAFLVAA